MNTTEIGKKAEELVARTLKRQKHKILDTNWRNKYCEIDIVTRKKDTIYFVEVKYRKNDAQGGGLEAIGPTKLRQMSFAAENWINQHPDSDFDYILMAASVSGKPPKIDDLIIID